MKKRKKNIRLFIITFISAIAMISLYLNNYQQRTFLSLVNLANIEALAWPEWQQPDQPGKIAKTERCKLELGGGRFESSVERVCYDQYVCPSCTCTPVACGDRF